MTPSNAGIWLVFSVGCFGRRDLRDPYGGLWSPPVELYSSPVSTSTGVGVQCGLFYGMPTADFPAILQTAHGVWVVTTTTNTRVEPIEIADPDWPVVWVTKDGLIARSAPPEGQVSGLLGSHYNVQAVRVDPGATHVLWTQLRAPDGAPGASQLAESWNIRTPGLVEQPLVCVGQWRLVPPELGRDDGGMDHWQDVVTEAIPVCVLFSKDVGWTMHPCGRTLRDR